jgi:UDP-N-acetylglucosamine--N-acetylmuramyl-(pentapeptide) pyrophosphoryl-undecaprenol N-acetylglucosamine transferase
VRFIMAGGGTGGHIIPAIAVARVLRERGHEPTFIGTQRGLESELVPQAGFAIEWIDIGGLRGLGFTRRARTAVQIPTSVLRAQSILGHIKPGAVFSMGGYVAGPVVIAAALRRVPVVVMEPNAIPGATNRYVGRWVARALLTFEETTKWFPPGKTVLTGLPVRREFFEIPDKERSGTMTVLITGGSQGSRTLNRAATESWPLFRGASFRVRLIHQTGVREHEQIATRFPGAGIDGEVVPFIQDMPGAFRQADVVVCRSGAGAIAELAAAGKPAILVPYPFATDNHQQKNAEALARAGAAHLIPDRDLQGARLFDEIARLASDPGELERLSDAVRRFAKPHAAERAADILEEIACR